MSETSPEYYVSTAPKRLKPLDYLRHTIVEWFKALSAECRCYVIGLGVLIVAIVVALLKKPEALPLFQLSCAVFAAGLVPAMSRLYEWVWSKPVGKLAVVAIIALGTTYAHGVGRQMVSVIVGTDPSQFTGSVNVASILMSPIVFMFCLAIGGFLFAGMGLMFVPFALMSLLPGSSSERKRICLWTARAVAFAIAVFGSWHLLQHSGGYGDWVTRRTSEYLYHFDMYKDPHYAAGATEKVALLSDGRVLVCSRRKSDAHYIFETLKYPLNNKDSDDKTFR